MYPRLYEQFWGYYPHFYVWGSGYYSDPRSYYYSYHDSYWQQEQIPVERNIVLQDYGDKPFVVNIEDATKQNRNFRTVLWTGKHLQLVVMSLLPGEDIGLEVHPHVDQFIRIEEGTAFVQMGSSQDQLYFTQMVEDDYAVVVPAGTWHNITNTGNKPLKLYTIYAPPEHPFGTIHETKQAAIAAETALVAR